MAIPADRPVPVPRVRRRLPGGGPAVRPPAGLAGRHLAVRPEPAHRPAGRPAGLPPGGLHRGPIAGARAGGCGAACGRGPRRAGGLHRGPAGGQPGPVRPAPDQPRPAQQPGPQPVLGRRPPADRGCTPARAATATPPTARPRVLATIRDHLKPDQRALVGVVDPLDPRVETPEEVRDRVLEAARVIPVGQLGTTDDCGFAPFSDDASTRRARTPPKPAGRCGGGRPEAGASDSLPAATTAHGKESAGVGMGDRSSRSAIYARWNPPAPRREHRQSPRARYRRHPAEPGLDGHRGGVRRDQDVRERRALERAGRQGQGQVVPGAGR